MLLEATLLREAVALLEDAAPFDPLTSLALLEDPALPREAVALLEAAEAALLLSNAAAARASPAAGEVSGEPFTRAGAEAEGGLEEVRLGEGSGEPFKRASFSAHSMLWAE